MRFTRLSSVLLVALIAAVQLAAPRELPAQGRPKVEPFGQPFDPSKFFEQLFGPAGNVKDEDLKKIQVSLKEESQVGRQQLDAAKKSLVARKIEIQTRGPEVTYLKKLLAELQPLMQQSRRYKEINVHFLETDEPQAFTFAGGEMLISRGMLAEVRTEAALVAVLGHELAHLDRGHLLHRIRQMKLIEQRLNPSGGFSPEKMFQAFGTMTQIFMQPFGPEEELEADRDGIAWAYELGYDPLAVEHIYAAVEKPALPGAEFMPAFFRTHPPSAERRENLAATVARLKKENPKDDLYLGRENLERRIPKSERTFDE